MQVWISNDGENGTVIDCTMGTTYTIDDLNYTVGVELDESNSTVSTNTDNVVRIVNWPLSSINGTKKVYAVFRDSFGNKTSTSGLSTITVSFDLSGVSGDTSGDVATLAPVTTVKNLGVYLPTVVPSAVNQSFAGWSNYKGASLPNYVANSLAIFERNTTVYSVYKTITAGDYVYYEVNMNNFYEANQNLTSVETVTYYMSDLFSSNYPPVFRVLSADSSSIVLCPNELNQTFTLTLKGKTGFNTGKDAINSLCAIYATSYSQSVASITQAQMQAHGNTNGLNSLFGNWFYDVYSTWGISGEYKSCTLINISSTQKAGLIHHDNSGVTKSQTYNVCPAITLSENVNFFGNGTEDSPYELRIYQ